jgi:cytochrome c oxidase subunit 2
MSAFGAASLLGQRVDVLFLVMTIITGLVALAIGALLLFFSIRYRRGSQVDRSNPPAGLRWLEITWIAVPLAIFLGLFAWSSVVFSDFYRPPADAAHIYVVAKQWMWKLEHLNGRREIDELHVPVGRPVELIMTSQDVIHSFFIPSFRVKQDVLPARYTTLWFTPTQVGTFHLFCAEYCGTDHAHMRGGIVVMPQHDFAQWLQQGPQTADLAARGFSLYRQMGCSGCHEQPSSIHAPDLRGLYGRTVHLNDGTSVFADENYIRDSILEPKKQVAAGFEPLMPSFHDQLTEDQVIALIAFLKSRPSS